MNIPDLRTILMDVQLRPAAGVSSSTGSSLAFISKVTEFVALRRISHERNSNIAWALLDEDEHSLGSDEGDDGQGEAADEVLDDELDSIEAEESEECSEDSSSGEEEANQE